MVSVWETTGAHTQCFTTFAVINCNFPLRCFFPYLSRMTARGKKSPSCFCPILSLPYAVFQEGLSDGWAAHWQAALSHSWKGSGAKPQGRAPSPTRWTPRGGELRSATSPAGTFRGRSLELRAGGGGTDWHCHLLLEARTRSRPGGRRPQRHVRRQPCAAQARPPNWSVPISGDQYWRKHELVKIKQSTVAGLLHSRRWAS